ncbi:hypothetical protein CRT23_21230 [Methylobacterium sp. V23]|jgi:hypothetical protein|nr:hypothetical protein CRT23_21230 [Methylobacterium sp. V23]
MPKDKLVAHLVQVISEDASLEAERAFYAVLTVQADEALRHVEVLCSEDERASLAGGSLSTSTARALSLSPGQPRRL